MQTMRQEAMRQQTPAISETVTTLLPAAVVAVVAFLFTAIGTQSFANDGEPSEDRAAAIDFDTEIMPILTRSGCNVGSCHGAAAGRGGFNLSLLGGDAQADFAAITEQFEGRRINLAAPEKSLVLLKPTLELDHEGGDALQPESAEKMRDWIAEGGATSSVSFTQVARLPARQSFIRERGRAYSAAHCCAF